MAHKTALITGAQGFTGHYMQAELNAAGYLVYGLGANPSTAENYRQVDLSNTHEVKNALREIQPQVIVHLAAIAFVGHENANTFYQVNLIGTRNLLEAIREMGSEPDCILLASSANVYGNISEGILNEDTTPAPVNDYAVSKLAMEQMASLYIKKLPIIITRPFNYTGVGQSTKFLIPKIISHFTKKAPEIELGNMDIWRDFSDVRSITRAYYCLLNTPRALGKTINVCSGRAYSLREIITMCEHLTGHTIDVRVNSDFVRTNEVKKLCGDRHLLDSILQGKKTERPLIETLSWMLSQ